MASVSRNSRWMLPLKVGVLSFSVLCLVTALKLSLPTVTEFAYSDLPSLWSLLMTWLRPPYLYVVINGIIITIVATSKLHYHKADDVDPLPLEIPIPAVMVPPEYDVYTALVPELEKATEVVVEDKMMMTMTTTAAALEGNGVDGRIIVDDDVATIWSEKKISEEFPVYRSEKPPVSGRFGHRKAAKSISEGGKALRVSKPKRQETLESTWKTITEGRPMPLARHLRKSGTWETHGQDPKMTKSETFNDPVDRHVSTTASSTGGLEGRLRKEPSGSWKLKKEPSLGQDELNKRVEAFIKKFNEDMRIQRQESLNRYMEMINRGAH